MADARRDVVIELEGVRAGFGETVVFEDVDLAVRRREIFGIVGASGSGKSVMLRFMIGLMRPQAGTIRVFGEDVFALPAPELHRLQRRWGVVFQEDALFSSLTLVENVRRVIDEHVSLDPALADQLCRLKISIVGLRPETAGRYPFELSGGMRKKAGLARALALDPSVLFLDEPTAGLDPLAATSFEELILRFRDTLGLTVVLVTHDLETLHAICDRIAVLAERSVVAIGTIDEVRRNRHPFIRDFFWGRRGGGLTARNKEQGEAAD